MLRPQIPSDEQSFIQQAKRQWNSRPSFTADTALLQTISATDGIDVATAVAYAHAIESPNRTEIDQADAPPTLSDPPRVIVMPGAFHAEYPHTGADGARVLDIATRLGWPAVRVPLPSLAPAAENADRLVKVLAEDQSRPSIIVSLSKGGADVRAAFDHPDASRAFTNVRAWVNLSGIVSGTPLIAWLRARPLRCTGVRMLLRLRGQRFTTLDELRHGEDAPLNKPMVLPEGLRAIHVVGFPLQRHLTIPWARRGHARLAPLGPNDAGGILLTDAMNLPGELIPIWGADHYLNPAWDIGPLLTRILQEAGRHRVTTPVATH